MGMSFRPLARLITRGILAILTFLRLLEPDSIVPNPNIPSTSIKLNTSLIEGVYNYHSSENFDAYLQELGVSWYLRSLAAIAAPVVSISRLDNSQCSSLQVEKSGSESRLRAINQTRCSTRWKIHTATFVRSH